MPEAIKKEQRSRRGEILDGARHCFAKFGYDGATVTRLEEATGKSRGAIFHHFGSKEGLFLALAEEDADQMAEVTASSGLVEVMRDVVAHPDRHEWLGTRLEIVGRLRTDADFRRKWLAHQEHLDEAVRSRLRAASRFPASPRFSAAAGVDAGWRHHQVGDRPVDRRHGQALIY